MSYKAGFLRFFVYLDKCVLCMLLAEGGGRGDCVEERGDPGLEGLSKSSSTGEGGSETESDPTGHSETERV